MQLTPLAPLCGAETHDFQMRELEGDSLEQLKQAVYQHGVVVLRGQELSQQDHLDFARRWGGIDVNQYFPLEQEFPEIAVVRKKPDQETNIGGAWHTDHSYDQIPAMGSILVARVLPPKGGDTLYAHMGAAYDALPQDLKDEIAGLEAFHTADHVYKADGLYAQTDMGKDLRGQDQKTGATHPIVISHPVTGRKLLYVNSAFTINIVGRSREESLPLLGSLYEHASNPDFQCRVVWEPGSVAIWDNRVTWHNAVNDYHGHAREMHRITLSGQALAA